MKLKNAATIAVISLGLVAGAALAKPSLAPSVSTPEAADKMVVIKDTTKSVNVFENDTVLFKVGDKQFAIKFDGNNVYYDLSTLAPPGVLTRKVKVYVAPNPKDHEQGIP
ncbi:MAG TPA: CzcE family metal-binding protein [Burkholderiaceae bacterium]|jgi:hypothetical protein